ncbi:hypothetical protein QP178_13340 [Sphingomonas aurantiaca]|uniref:hypothetical protein n=1 Tax=Sphingomonas aurantiaca TaxID=185949 RepID=UPI002FE2D03D
MKAVLGLFATALLSTLVIAASPTLTPTTTKAGAALPVHIGGRAERVAEGYRRQWPGTYFESAFRGPSALLKIGQGDIVLHVSVDGAPVAKLVKPKPGLYRVAGLAHGRHTIRVDVASESQSTPTVFGGFYAASGTRPLPRRAAPAKSNSSATRTPSATAISRPGATVRKTKSGRPPTPPKPCPR